MLRTAHGSGHLQDQTFHEHGESAAGMHPGHINLMDATPITSYPGHAGDDERLMLEEVHVPPFLLDDVMDRAATGMARWIREGGAFLKPTWSRNSR